MSDQEQNNPFAIGTLGYEEWEHREALEKAFCAPPGGLRVDGEDCNLCGAYVRAQARLKHALYHEKEDSNLRTTRDGFIYTKDIIKVLGDAVAGLMKREAAREQNKDPYQQN